VISFLTAMTPPHQGLSIWLSLDPTLLQGNLAAIPGLVTYALVHDPGNILHAGINMYLLYAFGGEVEILYRGRRFLGFLLAATLAGSVFHLLLSSLSFDFASRVVGGSGIVMAILAVNAAIYPGRILNLLILRCRMITFFLFFVGLDLLNFLATWVGGNIQVATDVHLAGAAAGWIWAGGFQRFDNPIGRVSRRWREKQAAAGRQRRRAGEAELDRILAKISRGGLPSLTRGERKFLKKRSRDR